MRGALLQHISLLRPLSFSRRSTSGWAEVRWDKGGGKNSYRIGADGCCDLEGVDSPNSGVLCPQGHTAHKFKTFHGGFNCDICKKAFESIGKHRKRCEPFKILSKSLSISTKLM